MTKSRKRARVGFAALALMLGNSIYVQAQSRKNPTENPFLQVDANSFGSMPTLSQINKGRALIAKLVNVLQTIPLMDADAVMAQFGINDVDYEVYPTHIRVTAKNQADLTRLGLINLSIRPWEGRELPNFSAVIDGLACIQKEDLDVAFGDSYKSSVMVLIDRGPPDAGFYPSYFYYKLQKTALAEFSAEISFGFYSKFCAESFGAGYSQN